MKNPKDINIRKNLNLAMDAAVKTGSALFHNKVNWNILINQNSRDRKLLADLESEKLLIDYLVNNSEYPLLTEETGWYGFNAIKSNTNIPDVFWVIDPLDGTVNYSTDMPLCCVSISLICQQKPVLGVVYDFNKRELFSGGYGQGAKLNEKDIQVSNKSTKAESILMTGLPKARDFSEIEMYEFAKKAAAWHKVRMIGSAALSMAYVANGRADAYQEDNIMFWDVAAGWALIEAAGGEVDMLISDFLEPLSLYASNGSIN